MWLREAFSVPDLESYVMDKASGIGIRYRAASKHLDERGKRLWAAAEAKSVGHGGIVSVSSVTGIARSTIGRGLKDIEDVSLPAGRVRRDGGGRHSLAETDSGLLPALRSIVEPHTVGDPMRPLQWVSKSCDKIAVALRSMGHKVGRTTVGILLESIGYRRMSNRKTFEGGGHVDRDAQFEHINAEAAAFIGNGQPVISVDTKKKEPIGDFKNGGTDYRPEGRPEHVRVYDFVDKVLGKAVPYGVYDLASNTAFVSVGIDHDTAEFSVNSIRAWWLCMGRERYPDAKRLMITADCGGSNGARVRLWKIELQKFADETGLNIHVCHYPPGCSKWNKIEHRLFCHITQNWRGKPLVSREVVVELIGATTTKAGLTVRCMLDTKTYGKGTVVTDEQLEIVRIERNDFCPQWNYIIAPKK